MNDYIESVFALDGIDIVGDDPHENNTATIRQAIEEYSLVGNYPHIAENRANTDNNESLILTAFANGGGYIMYEVVTSEYFIRNNSSSIDPDYGIYKTDLTKRSFTDKTAKFLKMLNNSGYATVAAGKDKFHAFNVENNYPSGNYESTVSIAGRRIKFSTGDAALGYIIEYDGALIIASDKTAQISGLQDISKVEEGEYKDGTWVKTKDVEVIKGFVNTGDYKIYRVLL